MNSRDIDSLYQILGEQIRLHRKRSPSITQEVLGQLVGLSRTSITNIENGRQHIALHQLYEFAKALKVPPQSLLPELNKSTDSSWVTDKIPEGVEKGIAEWAEKVVGE
ncbi:MAG: helix-turn-helix transcriptional regulator [Candidatus Thiodiazotropha endolucinida]